MELPRVNPGLCEIENKKAPTQNSSLQLQITSFFFLRITNYIIEFAWCVLEMRSCHIQLLFPVPYIYSQTFYILVCIIKKKFTFWLSHDYCACSKEKVEESWQHFPNNLILSCDGWVKCTFILLWFMVGWDLSLF